jgi:hypothetical protein
MPRVVRPKRQRHKEGDVFQIDLGNGHHAFGIVAAGKDHAFFDIFTEVVPSLKEITSARVAFRLWGPADALGSGRWKIIGNIPLTGRLAERAAYRNQPVGSNQVYLYRAGVLTPAELGEVKDLELTAWWNADSVEQRLKDHFAGRTNPTAERFKTIKKYDPRTGQEIK